MSGTATELANSPSDYICETCEDWSWCLPCAISQGREDETVQKLLEKGYLPPNPGTAPHSDWMGRIRFMIRYGIIRLDDIYTICNLPGQPGKGERNLVVREDRSSRERRSAL